MPRLGATWAVKSLAGVAVLSSAAVALALPVDASPTPFLALPSSSAAVVGERSLGQAASRSAARAAPPAVSAPVAEAPAAPDAVGVSGVKPVAKPVAKPKPKPKPKKEPATKSTAGTSPRSSSPSGASSSGSPARGSFGTGKCGGIGLTSRAAQVCSAVQSRFGLSTIGGYRPNGGEHSTGQAIDFMISSRSQGDAIAAYVQASAGGLGVKYVIWRQRYWEPGSSWRAMDDRGSATANHMDHVHVTVN
ncbi:MAG: hypothetical protein ABIU87_05350 [Ornithinibacter sp.]